MTRPISTLLVGDDPDLTTEWQAAEAGQSDLRLLAHFATNSREAVQIANSHLPEVIFLAEPSRFADLSAFVAELRQAAPGAELVGVLDRRHFESGDAETAFVVEAARAGLRDFLRRPLSSTELSGCLERVTHRGQQNAEAPAEAGVVTSFVSNKGGVGKTTLAVNTACELARRAPGRVLLVDAALQLGLCATMLDLEATVTMHDVVGQMDRLDATLLREMTLAHECGLDLLAAPGDAVEAAAISEEHLSRMLAVARMAYDHVIVDTFPILDGIAIATLDRSDNVWLVFAPTVPTVLGAERMVRLLEGVGVDRDRQHLVINASVPTHAGQIHPRDIAERLDRDIELAIPFCRAAAAACNSGLPVVLGSSRWSVFRRRIAYLADCIETAQHVEVS